MFNEIESVPSRLSRSQRTLRSLAATLLLVAAMALVAGFRPASVQAQASQPASSAPQRSAFAAQTGPPKTFRDAAVSFVLEDELHHPFYWWPRTLLSYPVRFEEGVRPEALSLVRTDTAAARPVPFQLSDVETDGSGRLASARVHFFSELPSGGKRRFELTTRPVEAPPPSEAPAVTEERQDDTIVLRTGAVQVRLPASQAVSGEAPGPIMQVSRDGAAWLGDSEIVSPERDVERIETAKVEDGPLFKTYQVTYDFEGDGTYRARVKAMAGMDFVAFDEEMENLPKEEGIYLETDWTGLDPTHRQAPNHPLQQAPDGGEGYDRYNWERVDQEKIPHPNAGVVDAMSDDGEISFRLGPFEPWMADKTLDSAAFWNEETDNTVGLFINEMDQWQDHEYAIWHASETLQVRYFYRDGTLSWRWPLATGTRSTAVTCYDHAKDRRQMRRIERMNEQKEAPLGFTYRTNMSPRSHVNFLRNRYGTLDLDKVKDWKLTYDGEHPPSDLFKEGEIQSVEELVEDYLGASIVQGLPAGGVRQNGVGTGPVSARSYYEQWVDAYARLYPEMTDKQRKRLTAMYLFMGYVYADEALMPMKTMLAGHPNFLSDVKSVPGLTAFLFPEHPQAETWANEYEKFMELNTRYHTRPRVEAWRARGGRWTENLGTYVWAFLRPTIRAGYALEEYRSGKNRLVTPQLAQLGNWAVNALSAPFEGEDMDFYRDEDGELDTHFWGLVTPEEGPRRLYPPQGAHSARRHPPRMLWLLGDFMRQYRPMVSEHLMWAARPTDDAFESSPEEPHPWKITYPQEKPEKDASRGTNPHLESRKFTGYGVTLRAGVGTPQELSLHLQQIDEGPNYRWGVAGRGGNGVIYYYAGGESYSHNGREDVGDRRAQDTDFATNFGVWKDGRFKSIGRNVLKAPMYDLKAGQFAKLLAKEGPDAYAWPEYQSRSVMLVGTDYFVTYDDVFSEGLRHRFSWFTHRRDTLPYIHVTEGGGKTTRIRTDETRGLWRDGSGDFMAVVSHKDGLAVEETAYGARVHMPGSDDGGGSTDYLFRDPDTTRYAEDGRRFEGAAGFIREQGDTTRLALFHGRRVGAGGLELATGDPDLGIGATFAEGAPAEARGRYFGREETTLRLRTEGLPEGAAFYIDGAEQDVQRSGDTLTVALPAGEHQWEVTTGRPRPPAPTMQRTANRSGGATVFFTSVDGASRYRIEVSRDGGASWKAVGTTEAPPYELTGRENGTKVHVRAVAVNPEHESSPADEYPLYVTGDVPSSPDGLKVRLGEGEATLSWGKVLGTSEYRLYRREKGAAAFKEVYRGTKRSYLDTEANVVEAYEDPEQPLPPAGERDFTLYEYAVTAVNDNGESAKSVPVTTNPSSWLNWDPRSGERYRRRYSTQPNWIDSGDVTTYYPGGGLPRNLLGQNR